MINVNENFLNLQDSYLFSTVAKKVSEYSAKHPDKKIIKLGIGDVTRPIVPAVADAMHKAVDEMANISPGFAIEIAYLIPSVLSTIILYGLPVGIIPFSISFRIFKGSSVLTWSDIRTVKSANLPDISPIIGLLAASLSPPTPHAQIFS